MKKIGIVLMALFALACSKKDDTTTTTTNTTTTTLPDIYKKFNSSVQVYIEGDEVVIKTTNVPDHKSPYFNSSDSRYEAYNGSNPQFHLNPNRIAEQNIVFRVPLNPKQATNVTPTPLGPIGISVNGIVFFNQYAGPNNAPLTNEINSFDQYSGHPQNSGVYHYHLEPNYLTGKLSKEAFLGVLTDGFPVYGPMENGKTITNSDLDDYHGHFGPTAEYPNGIYHYHFTEQDPYLNGNGFYGIPGKVTL